MKDLIKNPTIDVEMAAAVYLSAKTEALTRHSQSTFFSTHNGNPRCGTSACLAGHALIIEHGGFSQAVDYHRRDTSYEAFRALVGGAPRTFPLCRSYLERRVYDLRMRNSITLEEELYFMDMLRELMNCFAPSHLNETALRYFAEWVRKFSDESDRFDELISLDVDDLYREVELDREALAA